MSIGQQIINGTDGLNAKALSAFEELKAWCAKHLGADDYKVVPESTSFAQSIYFTESSIGFICFNSDGSVCGCGGCDEECMEEHLFDLANDEAECEEESASEIVADPPLTSIGGMMVRKMIAEYERKQH